MSDASLGLGDFSMSGKIALSARGRQFALFEPETLQLDLVFRKYPDDIDTRYLVLRVDGRPLARWKLSELEKDLSKGVFL